MARTIQSPGVELREVDLSLRPVVNTGTSVFITGFANQGPIDEILQPTSISEFEQIYGKPTNAAERYFYHTVKASLQSSVQLLVSRLPYGQDRGEGFANWRYSALAYPAAAWSNTTNVTGSTVGELSAATTYFLGTPTHLELSLEQYQDLINNNINWTNTPYGSSGTTGINTALTWETLGKAAVVVVNRAQTTVNNKFEGYYVGLTDNNNVNPATLFDGVRSVEAIASSTTSINNYVEVPGPRLNFALSANKFGDGSSISEVQENIGTFDISPRAFDDTLQLGLYKMRQSVFSPDVIALDYVLSEGYVGSLDYHRQVASTNGGPAISFFLGQQPVTSPNIRVIVNPFVSNRYTETWLNNDGVPSKKVRCLSNNLATPFSVPGNVDNNTTYTSRVGAASGVVASLLSLAGSTDSVFSLGVYTNTVAADKSIGALPSKLERVFELVENPDLYQINIVPEAGLGTIYVNAVEQSLVKGLTSTDSFVDTLPLNSLSALYTTDSEKLSQEGQRIRSNYTAVANVLVNQAQNQRKDFLVILDALRNIFVQGDNAKVINSKKILSPNAGIEPDPTAPGYVTTNFSQHIYWPLRHQFSTIDTSYACSYANCAQVFDGASNRQVWVPFSGFAAAAMGNTDQNFQPWFAPAGFTRGVLIGVNDLGVYPKQKQRDQLYKIGLNPVAFFPVEGFVIYGQKTLLKKPSAFDRINVRRLFLNLEVATRDTVKFYVFEPNTLFTRTQVINTLTPIFENAKNTEGVYDYLLICDERNNTPDVIDNNELKVDIYLKPVRTAEFILVSFYATRTSQNFQELVA